MDIETPVAIKLGVGTRLPQAHYVNTKQKTNYLLLSVTWVVLEYQCNDLKVKKWKTDFLLPFPFTYLKENLCNEVGALIRTASKISNCGLLEDIAAMELRREMKVKKTGS